MSWVTFDVKQPHAASVADGQVQFAWVIDQSKSTKPLTGGTLQYRPNANDPNPRTIFENQSADVQMDGSYLFGPFTLAAPKVNIPASPPFKGGNYNTLSEVVFTPSATSPESSGAIKGIFQDVTPAGNDDSCNWDATVTTPVPEGVNKAAY